MKYFINLFVRWHLNVDIDCTCLQQRVPVFAKHGEHSLCVKVLIGFFSLLFSVLLLPIISFKFLLLLKAVIVRCLNISIFSHKFWCKVSGFLYELLRQGMILLTLILDIQI